MHRRDVISSLGGIAAARAFGLTLDVDPDGFAQPASSFPRKADFHIEPGWTYLNAAYTHPIPKASVMAARAAVEKRGTARGIAPPMSPTPRDLFAKLVNAKPTEIAYVSSTSEGENLVTRALGLDHRFTGNVVTDGLHFEGSIMHLLELGKRGLEVRVVPPTADARIELADLERVIDKQTRLVEVSASAMYNGFQHDLKRVSEIAHAHGALVYADIVHLAGAQPFDIAASGVDFASCSSFKWLMGDFGLGFLYARESVLEKIERPVFGYYQAADIDANYPPTLPPGAYRPIDYTLNKTAAGYFEMGSLTGSAEVNVALLRASLEYVHALTPARIQAHRLPLIAKLQREVPRLGFTAVTPVDSVGANVTFARRNVGDSDIPKRLAAAKINVRVSKHWLRVSPSVYNDLHDIDRLLNVLS